MNGIETLLETRDDDRQKLRQKLAFDLLAGRLETTAMTPSSEPEAFALVERLFRIDQAAASPEREALSGDASVA